MVRTQIDGTAALLPVVYWDGIAIEQNDTVSNFCSGNISNNSALETFKRINKLPFTNLNIFFSDDVWDFNGLTQLPVSKYELRFMFNPDSAFCNVLKMFVLNDALKRTTKIRVLHAKFWVIARFLTYCEEQGYTAIENIPKSVYEEYFNSLRTKCTYGSICSYRGTLLLFLTFFERTFTEIKDPSIKKYLSERNTAKLNNAKEESKTPEVPVEYFPILLDGIKSIMRNPDVNNEDRITAACIILYSQIGFRTGELFTLTDNSLEQVYSPENEKPLYYLNFTSYKHGKGENGGTEAHTCINDLSLEAYNLLLTLCEPNRKRLNTNMLFVTKLQKGAHYSIPAFMNRYTSFFMRYWRELGSLNIGDKYSNLSSFEVGSWFKPAKDGTYNYDKNAEWAKPLKMSDQIYYPQIRQFRVSVCTSLYRQHIPMQYIKMHMNHLSEDMAAYYIRPDQDVDKKYSESVYRAVFKDGSKLLGTNGDAFVGKIQEFIEEQHFNVKDDLDEVIDAVASKFPLRSKVGGICIRCGNVIPCASNSATDTIYCAFGMCPNHCHMFFMADISYASYLQQKKLMQYNLDAGFKKAYQKEKNKLDYIVQQSLLPELQMLEEELQRNGAPAVLERYPQLSYIVEHFVEIKSEVTEWTSKNA